jgi:hypothetical protein
MHFERQQLSCRPREKEKHALPGLTWDWEVEAEEVAGAVVEPLVDGVHVNGRHRRRRRGRVLVHVRTLMVFMSLVGVPLVAWSVAVRRKEDG